MKRSIFPFGSSPTFTVKSITVQWQWKIVDKFNYRNVRSHNDPLVILFQSFYFQSWVYFLRRWIHIVQRFDGEKWGYFFLFSKIVKVRTSVETLKKSFSRLDSPTSCQIEIFSLQRSLETRCTIFFFFTISVPNLEL